MERFFRHSKGIIAIILVISFMFVNVVYTNAEGVKTVNIDGVSYNVTENESSYVLTTEKDGYNYEAVLEKLSNQIHITCDKDMFLYTDEIFDYNVEVENYDRNNAELEYTVKDNATGKEIKVDDSEYLEGQIPIAIYGGIALADIIAALLAAAAVVTIGGIAYYTLSDVIENIREESNRENTFYYYAMVQGSQLLIGSAFYSEADAIRYAASNINSSVYGVFCIGWGRASFLASEVSPVYLSYGDSAHGGSGYRPHYHPRMFNNGTTHYSLHCWY